MKYIRTEMSYMYEFDWLNRQYDTVDTTLSLTRIYWDTFASNSLDFFISKRNAYISPLWVNQNKGTL